MSVYLMLSRCRHLISASSTVCLRPVARGNIFCGLHDRRQMLIKYAAQIKQIVERMTNKKRKNTMALEKKCFKMAKDVSFINSEMLAFVDMSKAGKTENLLLESALPHCSITEKLRLSRSAYLELLKTTT